MAVRSPSRTAADLLVELVSRFRQRFAALALELDLSPPQMAVLTALDDACSMSDLAHLLHCHGSNVTWMTDRLEARGLVERRPDPRDRRIKRLVLTEEGRRLRRQVERRLADVPALDRLSPRERSVLAGLLERLLEDERA